MSSDEEWSSEAESIQDILKKRMDILPIVLQQNKELQELLTSETVRVIPLIYALVYISP